MKNLLAIASLFLFSSMASAAFIVEPGVGYYTGTLKQETQATSSSFNMRSPFVDLRLGWKFSQGAWVGVEGLYGFSGTVEGDTDPDSDTDSTTAYISGGYDFPAGFRLWGSFGLLHSLHVKSSASDSKVKEGKTYKVGVGYKVLPKVSVNLEYSFHDYKKIETGGQTYDLGDVGINFIKSETFLLSVSFPFAL